jgi:hypothetical protein
MVDDCVWFVSGTQRDAPEIDFALFQIGEADHA